MMCSTRFRTFQVSISLIALFAAQLACGGILLYPSSPAPNTPGVTSAWEQIDALLRSPDSGNLAYNAPDTMLLDEAVTVELRISPTLSAEELEKLYSKGKSRKALAIFLILLALIV